MTETRCFVYDFRYNGECLYSEIINRLKGIAKSFVFQKEEGDSGYIHYQGRMSLIKKRTKFQLLKLFENPPNYLEPTCNPEFTKGEAFYQMKIDTRIDGPWTDKDEVIYIPRQVREMGQLRPFQQHIVDDADIWNTRTINLIYNQSGNVGKSRLVAYCRAHKIGRALPPVNDCKDLMRMVCDMPTAKLYLFDMPRSMNKERLFQFYSAVESIKDGYAYDDRYHFKEKSFDCPNIWIFSNNLPDFNYLSMDRWKIWEITEDYNLQQKKLSNYIL